MFRIIRFRHLCITSLVVCFLLLSCTVVNIASLSVVSSAPTYKSIPIVMYHQISSGNNCGDYVLSVDELTADFEYFKSQNVCPISFRQLLNYVEHGDPLPPKPVIITFDDGTKSFLTRVVPLLEEFSYCANVNIIGSLVEEYTQNGDTNDSYAYLNSKDVSELSQNPLVEIGCHTYDLHNLSHRRGMGKLPEESDAEYSAFIKNDLEQFRKMYSSIADESLYVFAYPFGIKNKALPNILTENGYKIILTSGEKINRLTVGDSLTELGRFNRPSGVSSENFFKKLFPVANTHIDVYN